MPAGKFKPGWWHTTSPLNGRAGPSTSAKVRYVQPKGHNFWASKVVDGGGRTWLVSNRGTFYAQEYCSAGKAPKPKSTRPASPVPGYGCNYAFGIRSGRYQAGFHTGADYAAPTGTPIVAVVAGKVIRTGWGGAYGNWTLIRGVDGHTWVYCHQSRRKVKLGQTVKRGQVIGHVGTSGNVTGPHLHLEKSRGRGWSYAQVEKPTW